MEIEGFFPYRLAVTAEAFSRQLVAVYLRAYGLTREEWRLLFLLDDAGEIDSLSLSQRTSLDKVQVSRAAARLEGKGLITRAVLGSDRRLRHYAITPAGQALFAEAFAEVRARADEILSEMTESERTTLAAGIAALDGAVARVAARREGGGATGGNPAAD
ncbi:MarR family winged helix-turn-helix transcriptional regulator [Paracoccus sanguinis]|uniref:MarR family winged helix-turn-helix transcriptional regulator n=1 Tax=Paracoccus sanguinis TaxID=1545044 RepID=UPI00069081BC|nr:MarR family transcriptional regulator [Paracoccus sanguinis]